jgi:transposase, IS30 family
MENKRKFTQLVESERLQIYFLLGQGFSQAATARLIGRSPSTICRELQRNFNEKLDEYLPDTAERKAQARKKIPRKICYTDKCPELKEFILKQLTGEDRWSPEIISNNFPKDSGLNYSTESIYQYIYSVEGRKQNLRQYLRRSHRIRHKKKGRQSRKTKIQFRVGIEKRPKYIEKRKQFGHWEQDSVLYMGHSQTMGTLLERKSRKLIAMLQPDKSAKVRRISVNRRFARLPAAAKRTMTFDNGTEFAEHYKMAETLDTKTFFADTYASWQRGSLENVHGLLRWYLPKDTDLTKLTQAELNLTVEKINNRPRKCLNWKSPNQVYQMEMNQIYLKLNQLTN